MPRYLLDTNALSRLVSGRNFEIGEKVREHRPDCVVSAISWYELEYGRLRSPDPGRTAIRLALLSGVFPDVQVSPLPRIRLHEAHRIDVEHLHHVFRPREGGTQALQLGHHRGHLAGEIP